MPKLMGKCTLKFDAPPSINGYSSVVGKKEAEGPLKNYFDFINEDTSFGEKTWEKAESRMQQEAFNRAIAKGGYTNQDIGCVFAGDLLNQCISSSYGLRDFGVPFLGLYGACSTMGESMLLASCMIDGGFFDRVGAITSSHFCSAERQFRYPLEYGGQRTPTAQWTVTGSGSVILDKNGQGPYITHVTVGQIVDMGIKDMNNMGAAMAPAAYTTIEQFFRDTNKNPDEVDMILTGDLGTFGREVVIEFFLKEGVNISKRFNDCGCMIYDIEEQDVHGGGSGCGCSAVVFCGYIMSQLKSKIINKVLLVPTGALMSPTSTAQGESIPSIAHAILIENDLPS